MMFYCKSVFGYDIAEGVWILFAHENSIHLMLIFNILDAAILS